MSFDPNLLNLIDHEHYTKHQCKRSKFGVNVSDFERFTVIMIQFEEMSMNFVNMLYKFDYTLLADSRLSQDMHLLVIKSYVEIFYQNWL